MDNLLLNHGTNDMDLKDLNRLQPITWGFVVMLMLVTIVPGYLLIFLFNEQLFLEVDTIKLLFLSVSITMPLWSFNTFVCFFNKENQMSVMERLQFNGLLGAFFTFFPLYTPALVKLLSDIDIDCAIYIAGGVELFVLLACICLIFAGNKSLEKVHN